jgi:hypothetical protein
MKQPLEALLEDAQQHIWQITGASGDAIASSKSQTTLFQVHDVGSRVCGPKKGPVR